MGSQFDLFLFYCYTREKFFDFKNWLGLSIFLVYKIFYHPWRDHMVIPYVVPIWSLSLLLLPYRKVFWFQKPIGIIDFCGLQNFLPWRTDGGGGGGWWWMVEKNVLWFCSKFCQMKFTAYKSSVFWKICEKLFLSEKNPTSSFKIGGIFRKKIFRKFFETPVIISFFKDTSLYFGKKIQKLYNWKKIQLEFSKSGFFWKKSKSPR